MRYNWVNIMTRDYCGNYIYRNGAIERIMVGNGFLQDSAYYVQLKDYQGNVRTVLNQNGTVVERNSYYPYGGLIDANESTFQPYKYGSKELDRENGLDLYDSQARWYDPMLPGTTTQDSKAEKYYSISPYTWCSGNPMRFMDPDGKLIIFINGFHMGDGGQSKYWEGVDYRFMDWMKDYNIRYYDGSLGGARKVLLGSNNAENRIAYGSVMGLSNASDILSSLKNGEKIRFVTHSMGAAYTKGFIKGLQMYAEKNNIDITSLIQLEVDLAPYQPDKQSANENVRTIVISHKYDYVAGCEPMSGAENHVTRTEKTNKYNLNGEHSIRSFSDEEIRRFVPEGKSSEGGDCRKWEEKFK